MEKNKSKITIVKNKFTTNSQENKIYISLKRKANNLYKFYYQRARDLIYEKNYNEIFICGLGACVNEAIKLSLYINNLIPNLKIGKIETDSVTHYDEYFIEDTKEKICSDESRRSNLITIRLYKE